MINEGCLQADGGTRGSVSVGSKARSPASAGICRTLWHDEVNGNQFCFPPHVDRLDPNSRFFVALASLHRCEISIAHCLVESWISPGEGRIERQVSIGCVRGTREISVSG